MFYSSLYLAQIDHAEDVWLGFAIQNPLSLPGDIFIFRAKRWQDRLDPPWPAHSDTIFISERKIICHATYHALIDENNVLGFKKGKDMEGTDINRPDPNKKLVLQEYGEDEEDNTFSCHRKQVLPYEVPLKRVKSWSCACREEPRKCLTWWKIVAFVLTL